MPCTLVKHARLSGPVKSVIMPMPCAFCLRYVMLTLCLMSLHCLCATPGLQAKTMMSEKLCTIRSSGLAHALKESRG